MEKTISNQDPSLLYGNLQKWNRKILPENCEGVESTGKSDPQTTTSANPRRACHEWE